jgi:pilus assembly protein CpaE
VDGGSSLSDNTVTYLDSALRILLVITPNLASLRDAYQFIGICRTLSYPSEKILLIVNQSGRKEDIKMEEITKALQMNVFGTIPVDDQEMLKSMNDGLPIMLRKSNHPVSKAYKKIASKLAKLNVVPSLPQKRVEEKIPTDVLAKSARLG